MKKLHNLYIAGMVLSAFGVAILLFVLYHNDIDITYIIIWSILGVIAESLCILSPSGATISVGMAIYLSAIIVTDPLTVIIITTLSFLFRWPRNADGKRYFFSFKEKGDIYNLTAHVIIIGMAAYLYRLVINGHTDFVWVTLAALAVLTFVEIFSILLIIVFYRTKGYDNEIPIIKSIVGAIPGAWLVGALGLILAYMQMNYGMGIMLVFLLPVLLARYVFKLYFDAQRQAEETIDAFIRTLEVRDVYTSGHTERVEKYAVKLAKWAKCSSQELDEVKIAARLHDIGKIGIPDGVLNKEGKLTEAEFEQIMNHSVMGWHILSNVDRLKNIAIIVRHHHERPDGLGYPDGLIGEKIPKISSILSIVDSFDAMMSDRPYRLARTFDYAISELNGNKGTQFDERLVDIFIVNVERSGV